MERVLKQFEYLEDELDCRRRIPKIMKNADVVVGSSVVVVGFSVVGAAPPGHF